MCEKWRSHAQYGVQRLPNKAHRIRQSVNFFNSLLEYIVISAKKHIFLASIMTNYMYKTSYLRVTVMCQSHAFI